VSTSEDLRRDVGQLLWIGFQGTEMPEYVGRIAGEGKIGGAILFKRNLAITREVVTYGSGSVGAAPDAGGRDSLVAQAMSGQLHGAVAPEAAVTREVIDLDALVRLNSALHDAAADGHPPLFVAVDQEGGRVQRVRAPATRWPPMHQFEHVADEDDSVALAEEVGYAMGAELSALGFDIDFAPVLDIHTNAANPIIGDRAFGTVPHEVAARALAFAAGLARAGVLACGKHFPGHGDTTTDSHLELPRLDHTLERLRAVELVPFLKAAAAELPMLMTAHIVFAALDPDSPATLSSAAIEGLLRTEIGYRGLVVSDDLDMNAISAHYGPGDAAVAAVRAGCDVLLLCCNQTVQRESYEAMVRAAEDDSDFRDRVRRSATAIRALKDSHFSEISRPADSVVGSAAHRQLADRLAGVSGAV
jgi:beta-N-acetylhexosaminidase